MILRHNILTAFHPRIVIPMGTKATLSPIISGATRPPSLRIIIRPFRSNHHTTTTRRFITSWLSKNPIKPGSVATAAQGVKRRLSSYYQYGNRFSGNDVVWGIMGVNFLVYGAWVV